MSNEVLADVFMMNIIKAEAICTFNVHIANYTNIDVCKNNYLYSDCLCILLFAQSLYMYRVISTLMYV